jgi:putative DNA primase/helicase
MPVARALVKANYTDDSTGLPVLRSHRGDYFAWNGTCWPSVETRDVRAAAYAWLEHALYPGDTGPLPWAPTRRKVDDVEDALRSIVLVDSAASAPAWTNGRTDPPAGETVAMRNGLLHIPSRTLLPHTPAHFAHFALSFPYLPNAAEPRRWLTFLRQLWPDDESSIAALQEVLGYILGGDTRQQKLFLLVGPKRAGKGTIARVVTGLLGAHDVAAPTLASLSTNFGLQPLVGKPLAVVSDARLSGKADGAVVVERLLSISGEDSLTIDRKYRDPWTGRLPTRFLILTNELPRLTDSSGALASRFVVFVLTNSFYRREDPGLTEELLMEAPAIFNWSLAGLDRLLERGYFVTPDSGKDAIRQLEDLSSPISAFLRDTCEVGPHSVEVDRLWTAWKTWCEDDNRHPGNKTVFGRDLRSAIPTVKRTRPREEGTARPYVYQGLGLRVELQSLGPRTARTSPDPGPSGPRTSPMYPPRGGDRGAL